MRTRFILLLLLCSATRLVAQQTWTDHARLLPDRLRNIPAGINIYHSPTPVWPEFNSDTVDFPGKYIWKHSTRIATEAGELEVIAAGSYIWWKDKGWTPNIDLNREDFAKFFNCPGGILKTGKAYTFLKNYRYGDALYPGDALWFVLAKDKNGRIYKGIALVETEGQLKTADKN
ncbi:hypothetical protein [Mucilaginibacter xinganensis]|uniref:Uncharacterized protein n=1 Tax=Mucilaginibacter xinganensis TaxID=1234841 RepID=A0A223NU49_9SPHI|nr:hypothetical protein [Mucilaginibacter xinganensis]ASU33356.1 hypothetical protein MuYL_1458 [Mucilaginibacter xinganensis]